MVVAKRAKGHLHDPVKRDFRDRYGDEPSCRANVARHLPDILLAYPMSANDPKQTRTAFQMGYSDAPFADIRRLIAELRPLPDPLPA